MCDVTAEQHLVRQTSEDEPLRPPGHAGSGPQASERFDSAQAVADAVLYEGYLLYPYRRSSQKNRVRWQFGVLAPRQWLDPAAREDDSLSGSADGWYQQTECLLEAPRDAEVHVRLRFLQTVRRTVEQAGADGGFVPVDRLTVDDRDHLTFDEALPREFDITTTVGALMRGPVVRHIDVPGAENVEELAHGAGRIVRRSDRLSAALTMSVAAATAPFPVWKLRIRTENRDRSTIPGVSRSEALRASLIATHTVIGLTGGAFLSRIDAPEWAATATKACRNVHTFPVLAGDPARRDVMLSAPIVMYDHPQVSPESPGDLFDATEIDEILSLRTGTLTDDEKREARATDPRAAAIIDRVEQLAPEVMDRLHGAIRGLRPRQTTQPETVIVDGAGIAAGSRVRLQPRRRGADAHDIFLTGRTARVEKVLTDIDGERRIAVTVDDDPGADLHQWYGRYYYFDVDEVTPIDDDPIGRPQT